MTNNNNNNNMFIIYYLLVFQMLDFNLHQELQWWVTYFSYTVQLPSFSVVTEHAWRNGATHRSTVVKKQWKVIFVLLKWNTVILESGGECMKLDIVHEAQISEL
jgi:hypothetical protein